MLATALAASTLVIGHSVEGRPIHAVRQGRADAPRRVLVVGTVHGEEPGGVSVVRSLRARKVPAGVQLWTVRDANPDGARRRSRTNARGVDLNRNFGHRWRSGPRGRFYPGPRPFSEPETRALRDLIRRVKPHVTVWYHQPYGFVVANPSPLARAYAREAGMPVRRLPAYRGTAVGWQEATRPSSHSFVVELPMSGFDPSRHARALLRVTKGPGAGVAAAARPSIRWHPIPFGDARKRQMRAYARRHYGLDSHLLEEPRTIVQHFTATTTLARAVKIFASNARDPELRELPGVCAHFVVDRDGAIHQLVSLRFMCRHTIGLNHRSIGIEHVGISDAQVMGNARQRAASLRLTRWLMGRHGIPARHVIGHSEALRSPFHEERVARLRERRHLDFSTRTMRRYRGML